MTSQPGELLVVRVRPVYLDEVRLFDLRDTSGRVRIAGDRSDWNESEFKSLNHGFLIPAADRPATSGCGSRPTVPA